MKTKLSLLMLSFASILFAQTGVPSGAPTADLLGYYPFESNPTNASGSDGAALVETEPYEGGGGNILFIYDNAEGCNSIEEIEIACETFSTELFLTSDVSIYPNPFKNQLTIQLPEFAGTSKVSLVDVSGRVLVQQEVTNSGILSGLDELAKGLYFVKITSEDGQTITQKLIK